MSLNPIQFGEHVVEQFQRYLLTYFPIADRGMRAQVSEHLSRGPGGKRELVRGPYIHLNRPFEPGPALADLVAEPELDLHPDTPDLFRFEQLYKHQELAVRHILSGRHTIMATATGSGKTEGFLLPILNHCLHLRDGDKPDGVTAALVYPMNALVNDQLDRLRRMLAGSGITFGRYTGDTPRDQPDNINHLDQSRHYTEEELRAYREDRVDLPRPWEECVSREQIRARKPRLLLTNYRMLEFLLLRDQDLRELLQDAPMQYIVFDEVHTYSGTLGSEVACLIRRLRHVSGKSPRETTCIGTSATVRPGKEVDADAETKRFAHRLFGVPEEDVELVGERYRDFAAPPADSYIPAHPSNPRQTLDAVLAAAREVHLQEEVEAVPEALLAAAEELCGRAAPTSGSVNDRLHALLSANEIVQRLSRKLTRPLTLEDLHNHLRQIGDRASASEEDLTCDALAYLTLGAICQQDNEPLLRPKLHYFVQGYPGLWVSFEPERPDATDQGAIRPVIHFQQQAREGKDAQVARLPLLTCRACGQHYLRALAQAAWATGDENAVRAVRAADPWEEPADGEVECYLTDHLHTEEEDTGETEVWYLCRWCGALHRDATERCGNEKCERTGTMVPTLVFEDPKKLSQEGEGHDRQVTCAACGSRDTITGTRSVEVADIHTLAESMLSAMEEQTLRKLLVFSDNRQEAAFQAGWMKRRSERHAMRHLLYTLLREEGASRIIDELTDRLLDALEAERVLRIGTSEKERRETRKRVGWFVTQEFASRRERFGNLETLGLARIEYEGLSADSDLDFFRGWAERFGIEPDDVVAIVRVLLDSYRRRGALSHDLLQRHWNNRDKEVCEGFISVGKWWRPTVITLTKVDTHIDARGLLASKGQTAAQHIVSKGVRKGSDHVDHFLEQLWDWLRDDDRQYLVPVEITGKWAGKTQKVEISAEACQINALRTRVALSNSRQVCNVCQSAQRDSTATAACPEYRCKGSLVTVDVDTEHYAVVRYTREKFVPLRPAEHSGQVGQRKREQIEDQFKEEDGEYNCIVCTPTLELGVDIGQLEMALMRNVPPTPANYAQRAGRAGRRHRIAVVVNYCGTSPHDRYYFARPKDMIDGRIRVPAFSMTNEPLIRKHVHSAILTLLRQLPEAERRAVLSSAFPRFIWPYFMEAGAGGNRSGSYRDRPPTFPDLHSLVEGNVADLQDELTKALTATWPFQDKDAVASDKLAGMISKMSPELERHVRILFQQVDGYQSRIKALAQKQISRKQLTDEEKRERDRCDYALKALSAKDRDRYTLSYLSNDGYFPGYALTRDACIARCLQPYIELQRPEPVALREFTPANWIYAAGNEFAVARVDFFSMGSSSQDVSSELQRRDMLYDGEHDRVIDLATDDQAGRQGDRFLSFRLGGVELRQRQHIDDSRERRVYGAQDIVGTFLGTHHGGVFGELGDIKWHLYQNADLRLVNLGPFSREREGLPIGIPLCTVCGAVRSPHAGAEIDKFEDGHDESCGKGAVIRAALHVDFRSDLVELGPLRARADAVNLMEAMLAGAREYLDMGESDLEGFVEERDDGQAWVLVYDPMPGGSGFLQQLRERWRDVCAKAGDIMSTCDCDEACYACLLTFWNQRHHAALNRHRAAEMLALYSRPMTVGHTIPPSTEKQQKDDRETDSPAEDRFLQVLEERNFPEPEEKQYVVQMGGGSTTAADFAYASKRVLIYVDGMIWHDFEGVQRSERITRIRLRNEDWKVVEMTAQDLHDTAAINRVLEELAVYLERDELLRD